MLHLKFFENFEPWCSLLKVGSRGGRAWFKPNYKPVVEMQLLNYLVLGVVKSVVMGVVVLPPLWSL